MHFYKLHKKLLNEFQTFLYQFSSYRKDDIEKIIYLLDKYFFSYKRMLDVQIILELQNIVFKELNLSRNYSLLNVKNKYADSDLLKEKQIQLRHVWILRSIISRIKLYRRQNKSHNIFTSQINNDGIIKVPNFISKYYLDKLKNEFDSEPLAINKGSTKTIRHTGKIFSSWDFYPRRLYNSSHVLEQISQFIYPLGYADNYRSIRKMIHRSSFWQKINIINEDHDIQKDCHMDTFFPSLKFWYFPYKVSKKLAFKYVKSSHLLSLKRMIIESKKINHILNNNKFDQNEENKQNKETYKSELEGSLRFSNQDLENMDLNIESHYVDANTLIVADVSGLHSRSIGEDDRRNSMRIAIHGNIRHLNIF